MAGGSGAARALAAGADRDVAEYRAELRGHTRVRGTLRETQVQQGQSLDRVDAKDDDPTTSPPGVRAGPQRPPRRQRRWPGRRLLPPGR
ncbi:hypothetical protein GCM10007977_025060 [Dactylosporangium sucinum]|uniref:Uncharacterized protein n=1 Tax=Dactylosporangium sucinum TaxID=1424081 RepID=A0A917WR79_9ACTN|nr:hypothetical protein GCM10007977_025060 [Dactylosporangium sucinum]